MTEAQYTRYKDLPETILPPMANQVYLEDPKMLGIRLARYKFVAKLLAGKRLVAEVGAGDGFFSRLVEKEVRELRLFDLDPAYVVPLDIVEESVPGPWYNAIYSLDVFEHIAPEDTHTALMNVCRSLDSDGVFICGMPSLESQQYASEDSRLGHKNCMSGVYLKSLMEKYFKNVFLFSMHDEVVTTAFSPMAHYIITLSVGVK
jgi:cyclopropane fatty-acyl-phospholipid synthase-like methyltransferase